MTPKPPLGVSPHWFVNRERMQELCDAIGRYIEYIEANHHIERIDQYYTAIANWARELEALALLEAELEKRDSEK